MQNCISTMEAAKWNHFGTWYNDRGSVDRNSVDRNCVLSLDQNFVNHLTEFHLTESVDRNFNNVILSYFKLLIKCQKRTDGFWQLIKSSNNGILGFLKFWSSAKIRPFFFGTWSKVLIMPKIPLLELSIKCQKRTYGFWHLIESLK